MDPVVGKAAKQPTRRRQQAMVHYFFLLKKKMRLAKQAGIKWSAVNI